MNIHEKLRCVASFVGVIQKNKTGYSYKYCDKLAINTKLSPALSKYHVNLEPTIVPGTFKVEPVVKEGKNGKGQTTEYLSQAELEYAWINIDKPEDKIVARWPCVGMMGDPSQAFGAGVTYCSRYYIMESLILAITELDVDAYRTQQQKEIEAEETRAKEEEMAPLKTAIKEIKAIGEKLIANGTPKEEVAKIVAQFNNGSKSPSSITTVETAGKVIAAMKDVATKKSQKETDNKKQVEEEKK